MITKIQAATLYAYGYRILGHDDKKFNITELHENGMWIKSETGHYVFIKYTQIGVDYFILARQLEQLTQMIEVNGVRFVPKDKFFIMYGGGIGYSAKTYWENNFIENILYTPLQQLDYEIVELLRSWHFNICFPEGTVKELK